jgi:hypothetical protein
MAGVESAVSAPVLPWLHRCLWITFEAPPRKFLALYIGWKITALKGEYESDVQRGFRGCSLLCCRINLHGARSMDRCASYQAAEIEDQANGNKYQKQWRQMNMTPLPV